MMVADFLTTLRGQGRGQDRASPGRGRRGPSRPADRPRREPPDRLNAHGMMVFWIMTAACDRIGGAAGAQRRRGAGPSGVASAETWRRRELAELDRLKARGLLDDDGWTAARAEAGRRVCWPTAGADTDAGRRTAGSDLGAGRDGG